MSHGSRLHLSLTALVVIAGTPARALTTELPSAEESHLSTFVLIAIQVMITMVLFIVCVIALLTACQASQADCGDGGESSALTVGSFSLPTFQLNADRDQFYSKATNQHQSLSEGLKSKGEVYASDELEGEHIFNEINFLKRKIKRKNTSLSFKHECDRQNGEVRVQLEPCKDLPSADVRAAHTPVQQEAHLNDIIQIMSDPPEMKWWREPAVSGNPRLHPLLKLEHFKLHNALCSTAATVGVQG